MTAPTVLTARFLSEHSERRAGSVPFDASRPCCALSPRRSVAPASMIGSRPATVTGPGRAHMAGSMKWHALAAGVDHRGGDLLPARMSTSRMEEHRTDF
jgi:hypothetical protein